MVEMFKEKLFCAVQQTITNIDKTVEAIEKALEKLSLMRDMEIQLSSAFVDESQRGDEQAPVDVKIASLKKLREELLEEKEKNLLLIREFDRFLHSDSRYPGGHGMVCVTVEPLIEQANCCEVAAQRISGKANKAGFEVMSILDDKSMAKEAAEIIGCVENYERASHELMAQCREVSTMLRQMSESYSLCKAAMGANCGDFFEDRRPKEEIQKRSTVPPPVQASCSMPVSSRSRQDEDKMRRKVESRTENNSKKGIFGLFKGKKTTNLDSSKGNVLPPPHIDSVQFSAVAPNRVVPRQIFANKYCDV